MLLFAIISSRENATLATNISQGYASNHLAFSPSVWFVADKGVTTAEVCAKIGVVVGVTFPDVVVVKIESYYGLANTSVWEWFKVKVATA